MTDLRGQVAVVTGGARRLGRATVLALANHGMHVVVHYRQSAADAAATVTAARAAGVEALALRADATHPGDVDALLEQTLRTFGRVDALVTSAGAFRRTPLASVTDADWRDMLADNLEATFVPARCFGLHMRDHGGGAIVTFADVAALRPWAEYAPYCAAKAGVVALTYALAKELAPTVRVNAIAPGPVLFPDDFDAEARAREIGRTLLRRAGEPEHVADAVVTLLRNDYITGVILPVDGGRLLA